MHEIFFLIFFPLIFRDCYILEHVFYPFFRGIFFLNFCHPFPFPTKKQNFPSNHSGHPVYQSCAQLEIVNSNPPEMKRGRGYHVVFEMRHTSSIPTYDHDSS